MANYTRHVRYISIWDHCAQTPFISTEWTAMLYKAPDCTISAFVSIFRSFSHFCVPHPRIKTWGRKLSASVPISPRGFSGTLKRILWTLLLSLSSCPRAGKTLFIQIHLSFQRETLPFPFLHSYNKAQKSCHCIAGDSSAAVLLRNSHMMPGWAGLGTMHIKALGSWWVNYETISI